MILRDDIVVLDALTDGLILFKKHMIHGLLVVLLQLFGTYIQTFVLQTTGWKSGIIGLPWMIFILLMNLSLIVAIKGSYEKKPIGIKETVTKASTYLIKAIIGLILAGLAYFFITLLIGFIAIIMSAFSLVVGFLSLVLLASFAFVFVFMQQGIVIGELDAVKALNFSFQIFKANYLKFLAIAVIFVITGYFVGIGMDQVSPQSMNLSFMFMKFVEHLLACIALFITTSMFYQVSHPDVSFRTWE